MNKRSLKTRKAIREALLELLSEKDMTDITVSELAERADIDRRTFYLHYATVKDIFDEIISEAKDQLKTELEKLENKNLSGFLKILNNIHLEKYDFFKQVLINPSCFPLLREVIEDLIRKMSDNFLAITELPEEKIIYFSSYICFGMMGMYIKWYRDNGDQKNEDFHLLMEEVITNNVKLIMEGKL